MVIKFLKEDFSMKNTKKIVAFAAAAVLALSAVGASAATVPVPADNAQAFELAESFYYDGLYYEAKQELEYVKDVNYDGAKKTAWDNKISFAIDRMEIDTLLNKVETEYQKGEYSEALTALYAADSHFGKNQNDYYAIKYWEDTISAKLATAPTSIDSGSKAILAVKQKGYTLTSDYERYVPVKVDNGYHVYIQTWVPGGDYKDVSGIKVAADGTVEKVF